MTTITLALLTLTCGEGWWSLQPLRLPPLPAVRDHRLAFGTPPDAHTLTALIAHAETHGWPATCRVLLNANAFVFVD
jgi:hypothetical protein